MKTFNEARVVKALGFSTKKAFSLPAMTARRAKNFFKIFFLPVTKAGWLAATAVLLIANLFYAGWRLVKAVWNALGKVLNMGYLLRLIIGFSVITCCCKARSIGGGLDIFFHRLLSPVFALFRLGYDAVMGLVERIRSYQGTGEELMWLIAAVTLWMGLSILCEICISVAKAGKLQRFPVNGQVSLS